MKGKKTCFINQAITNKITGLVKGNYVDLTHFHKVAGLSKRRLEVCLFYHRRKSYPLLNMREISVLISKSEQNTCNMMK